MHKILRTLSAAACAASLLLLGACSNEPETIEGGGPADPDAKELAAAKPAVLPPMVTASRTYRCKDNSLVFIDFFNNKTAIFKTAKDAPSGITLSAPEDGQPYVAEGYSVSGNSAEIMLTAPGKGATSCKA